MWIHRPTSLATASVLVAVLGTALPALPPALAAEAPVAAEKNPPGDIPDSQVFIVYRGAGFAMKVPEGWSRTDEAAGARFFDKYNTIEATISDAATAPTPASVKAAEAAQLSTAGRAVKIIKIAEVKLDGGPAVRIDYSANSAPNAVTNKQIRLEDVRFLIFSRGKLVTLDMAAPLGADNADQWALMANSVRLQ